MIWVGWRRQRTETLIAAALLAALAALLIPTGLTMASAYDHGGLASCVGHTDAGGACGRAVDAFFGRFQKLGDMLDWVTLVPGIVGLLLAAPFVVALEQRTHRLDWTQSITRRRWVAGKFALAIATALVVAVALTLLMTWWRAPFARLEGRIDNSVYDSEGTVVAAYALFALGLGLAVGATWRRTVPALFVGFAGYFAARLFVDTWLRQRLVSPLTATWGPNGGGPDLGRAWVLDVHPVDRAGHLMPVCPPGANACPVKPGTVGYLQAVYHPASHFWPLQMRETALFGVAAVALIAFAVWWTLRRE